MPAYFSSLGLSLSQRVTVALPGTACCSYTCISLRVFLLSPPPPSLSPLCLSACLPACLSVCLSICLSACLSVRFCLPPPPPPPPPPLSLFVPLFLHFPPSFPLCSVSPLSFNLFSLGFSVVILFCFLSCVFFLWIFLLHVQVLSVCNIALAVCILSS